VFSLNPTFVEIESPDARSLLQLAQAGDVGAFGQICRTHETRLLRQAFLLCGDETLASDLAQETLIEAWKCLRRYNERCLFFTWLCAILLNRHRNLLRRRLPRPFSAFSSGDRDELEDHIASVPDPHSLPDEAAQMREQAARVRACIQALPVKQQQVIQLRFYVDDSLEGIAAALGCSVGTVKSRLFHALDNLRGMNALNEELAALKTKDETL
jgi:RNA polymerase sigma factor (sigma-70 family)